MAQTTVRSCCTCQPQPSPEAKATVGTAAAADDKECFQACCVGSGVRTPAF